MRERTYQMTVEKVSNGFQVFLEDHKYPATIRPVPYVFETMENLLDFISKTFN